VGKGSEGPGKEWGEEREREMQRDTPGQEVFIKSL
jgi:hypothetical protein